MAQGDRVKVGAGFLHAGTDNIAIYHVDVDSKGIYIVNDDGVAIPKPIGGVTPGSTGTVDGHPVKVEKRRLFGYEKVPSLGGVDTVLLFPVHFDKYKQTAWVPQDFFKVIDGHHFDMVSAS